jgi:hypothetical protein
VAAQVPRAPAGADYGRPAPARIYDYMLRGDNHFQTDILAAERILSAVPEIRDCAWSNRGFHQRAAKWIAERGVRQFIDIGSGLPTVGNTHEVAQKVIPGYAARAGGGRGRRRGNRLVSVVADVEGEPIESAGPAPRAHGSHRHRPSRVPRHPQPQRAMAAATRW